jgi:hypothetical protein
LAIKSGSPAESADLDLFEELILAAEGEADECV